MVPITGVYKEGQIGILPQIIGVKEALKDLPIIAHAEDGSKKEYIYEASNPFQRLMRGKIQPKEYLDSYK